MAGSLKSGGASRFGFVDTSLLGFIGSPVYTGIEQNGAESSRIEQD